MNRHSAPLSIEELARRERKLLRQSRRRRVGRAVDRIFGFLLATGLLLGVGVLGLSYVFVKGPSPALSQYYATTFLETRRFGWITRIFLTGEETADMIWSNNQSRGEEAFFDPSLVVISTPAPEENLEDGEKAANPYGDVDEDGDGIILETVNGNGFVGYMIKVLDPRRVFVSNGLGQTLGEQCASNGALGGINGGAFLDFNGTGDGRTPEGLTIVNGEVINYGYEENCFCGLNRDGLLIVGWYSLQNVRDMDIVSGVTWGPILIQNSVPADLSRISSGLNPRTAIGQRADGCILMLVIDGRQVHSFGATYRDVQEVMLQYGAVNAFNLDGGSSTTMYLNGQYVNSCSSANGIARPIPDAFLFR